MALTRAVESDFAAVVTLVNGAYRGESGRRGWTHEDYISGARIDVAELAADLARAPNAMLMVLRGAVEEQPIGCVWLEPTDAGVWYLGLLAVRPDLQDRRLGRTVLQEAEDLVKQSGGCRIRMTVVSIRDTLIAWYRRRGYELTGETLPFPYGNPPRTDLQFVVLERRV